jgi:hypothetical protein
MDFSAFDLEDFSFWDVNGNLFSVFFSFSVLNFFDVSVDDSLFTDNEAYLAALGEFTYVFDCI